MKRESRRQRLVAEINITPFTDVILVLLVIFMIATPLISQTNIKVRLPEAKSGQPIEAAKTTQLYITVTRDGSVYLDKDEVTGKSLKSKIDMMRRKDPDIYAVIHADKMVSFKDVVSVLDVLNESGISKLSIGAIDEGRAK